MHPDVILYARAAFIKKNTDALQCAYKELSAELHRVNEIDINKKQKLVAELKIKATGFFKLLEQIDPGPTGTMELKALLDLLEKQFSERIKETKEHVTSTNYLDAERYNALVPKELQSDKILPTSDYTKALPSLFGLYEHLWDKDLRAYVESKERKSFDVLVKIPGEGKTSRLLAVATKIHTVLLTINVPATFNSVLFKDPSYPIANTRMDAYTDHFGLIQNARREVDQMILIRFLHLLVCLTVTNLSPLEYVLMQLNGANDIIADMAEFVNIALEKCSSACIRSLVVQAVKASRQKCKKVGFCVDELSAVAYTPARL